MGKDQSEFARLGHVTPARLSQIMGMLSLAPDIQEAILFLPRVDKGRDRVTERDVRRVANLSPGVARDSSYSHTRLSDAPFPAQTLGRLSVSRGLGYQGVGFALSIATYRGWLRGAVATPARLKLCMRPQFAKSRFSCESERDVSRGGDCGYAATTGLPAIRLYNSTRTPKPHCAVAPGAPTP